VIAPLFCLFGPCNNRETVTHQIAYTATSVGYAAASAALNFALLGVALDVSYTHISGACYRRRSIIQYIK
jgi:hypothetical protein